jgi:type VI secretion system protein ImpA
MSVIDVDRLLAEVSSDTPCGENLEYDAAFMEMTRVAAGRPAQVMGGQTIPAEEPDWRDVRDRCVELFGRTKDLRIGVTLTRALARTDGLQGFADGLAVMRGLVERYWERVHPELDATDGNDPTFRVNTLAGLADRDLMVSALRTAPLASSRRMGRYALRDVEIANGTLPRPEGDGTVADTSTIDAAFLDTDAADLESGAAAVQTALDHVVAIDAALARTIGAAESADFTLLRSTLKSMSALLQQQLGRRGLSAGGATDGAETGDMTPGATTMSGPIQGREDIIRTLDQVMDWYARNEPSSPVPLLLARAKRLVNKSFLEAVQDLTPSGLTELQSIAGTDSNS